MSNSYTAFHGYAVLVTYHRAVADEGLVEVNLLFIDQLAESSDLSNLLNNHGIVLSISIDSHAFNDKRRSPNQVSSPNLHKPQPTAQ